MNEKTDNGKIQNNSNADNHVDADTLQLRKNDLMYRLQQLTITKRISVIRILLLTLLQAGVNLFFSTEFIFVTPLLIRLGASRFIAG